MANALTKAAVTDLLIDEPDAEDLNQYLTFHIDKELLAIGILDIKEIIEVGTISRVPLTPAFIRGVINLRGRVLPVLDLSARLGRRSTDLTKRSCIVIVEVHAGDASQTLGMLVDEVNEVIEISPENIQPAPDFGTDIRTDFIDRMGKIDDVFIVILNVNNVLSIEELAALNDLQKTAESA